MFGDSEPSGGALYDQTRTLRGCPVWRSLSSVGASIGDPFEGAGTTVIDSTGSPRSTCWVWFRALLLQGP